MLEHFNDSFYKRWFRRGAKKHFGGPDMPDLFKYPAVKALREYIDQDVKHYHWMILQMPNYNTEAFVTMFLVGLKVRWDNVDAIPSAYQLTALALWDKFHNGLDKTS